jgi:hypothetical protein
MNKNSTTEKNNSQMARRQFFLKIKIRNFSLMAVFVCGFLWAIFLLSCRSSPTDLRNLVPVETIIYLETDDLGKIMKALTENQIFLQSAQKKPDFSVLNGMQLAVAVTGFEASEEQVMGKHSILNFKPQFVAVAETHTWNRYALRFAEENLGEFVNETYGGEVVLEVSDKADGKYFVWTAKDGRQAFAFVRESLVFFSNDEKVLEKSLAILRGEGDSFAKSGKFFEKDKQNLAVGYVSTDGIAQISNLIGVSTAVEIAEDEQGQSLIARLLPQIIRNNVKEITWTATKTEQGIEDRYRVLLTPENASVLKETLVPPDQSSAGKKVFITPNDVFTLTRYNLKNPQIAWRSLISAVGRNLGMTDENLLSAAAESIFEPYHIADAETFLGAVDSEFWTVNFDAEAEESVVIVSSGSDENIGKLKKSVTGIDFKKTPKNEFGGILWTSENDEVSFFLTEMSEKKIVILGSKKGVEKASRSISDNSSGTVDDIFHRKLTENNSAVSITLGKSPADRMIEALGEKKELKADFITTYITETSFGERGFERKTISPFGLIGRIIEQLEN